MVRSIFGAMREGWSRRDFVKTCVAGAATVVLPVGAELGCGAIAPPVNARLPSGQVAQSLPLTSTAPAAFTRRSSPGNTMFVTAGRRLYVIGDIDGRFRPRSNPYDVARWGHAQPDDPLAGKLQGVWAQPVKGLAGYQFVVTHGADRWPLEDANAFVQDVSDVELAFERDGLRVTRHDFAPDDRAVLLTTLTLHNITSAAVEVEIAFLAHFELVDAWFTSLMPERNARETAVVDGQRIIARADVAPDRWAVVVGGDRPARTRVIADAARPIGELVHRARVAPGEPYAWTIAIAIDSETGSRGALRELDGALADRAALLRDKQTSVRALREAGPHLVAPEPRFVAAFEIARTNLRLLEAESPALGRYFYAGLEMFPFWFSNDGAYSTSGLLAAGMAATIVNHARIGQRKVAPSGQIPHQVSPSGKVVAAGNAQETSLWVLALGDLYRWTGDRALVTELLPTAVRGLFDYVLGTINPDGDGYPVGQGQVEVEGMVEKNIDSTCYLWAALGVLGELATAVGDAALAERARAAAASIAQHFDTDWWDAEHGTYAAALAAGTRQRRPAPVQTVFAPLEIGLATPEHAAATFAAMRRGYVGRELIAAGTNETFGGLAAGTLSRAAYRNNEPELGFEVLGRLTESLEHGAIGMFHERLPDKFCFIQLWSASTFVRGVVEDLLGLRVHAGVHQLAFAPHLPDAWDHAELERVRFGDHVITARVTKRELAVTHVAGSVPLEVDLAGASFTVAPGQGCRRAV